MFVRSHLCAGGQNHAWSDRGDYCLQLLARGICMLCCLRLNECVIVLVPYIYVRGGRGKKCCSQAKQDKHVICRTVAPRCILYPRPTAPLPGPSAAHKLILLPAIILHGDSCFDCAAGPAPSALLEPQICRTLGPTCGQNWRSCRAFALLRASQSRSAT